MLNFLFAQVVAPIESGTATNVMGWGGFVFGLVACGILLWDRVAGKGRSLAGIENSIRGISEDCGELKSAQRIMDGLLLSLTGDVRELKFEIKGVDGQNGMKALLRQHSSEIESIHVRNRKADILAAIYERELKNYGGPERREAVRRARDLIDDAPEGG